MTLALYDIVLMAYWKLMKSSKTNGKTDTPDPDTKDEQGGATGEVCKEKSPASGDSST